MPRRFAVALAALTLVLAPKAAPAIDAQPAEQAQDSRGQALEILARHVEAVGGRDAILSHKSVSTVGRISVPAAGLEGTIEAKLQAPDKSLTTIEITGYGVTKTGFDGQTAWMIDPTLGAMVMDGAMRESLVRSSRIDADLRIEKDYDAILYTGEDEIDGQGVHTVLLVDKDARESTHYFSKETGLRVAISSIEASQFGDMPVRYTFDEYKEYDGLKHATRTRQHVGPQTVEFILDTVSYDPIPDGTFAPPEAIRVLVRQQASDDDEGAADDDNGADDDADDDGDDDDGEDD